MSNQQNLSKLIQHYLAEMIDSRYDENTRKHCEKVFNSEALSHMSGLPNSNVITTFCTQLLLKIGNEILAQERETVLALIEKEVSNLISNLFDEDESLELYTFCNTPVGKKLLRNLDLVREAYAAGANHLTEKMVVAWSAPEVGQEIANFIVGLNENELM